MRSSVDSDAPAACLKRAASSGCASRTSRNALSPHTGTSPDGSKLSLARSPSSRQIASASEYLLASKAIVGLPSTSIVNIESENLSFISPSPSAPAPQDFRAANSTRRSIRARFSPRRAEWSKRVLYDWLLRGGERTFRPFHRGVVTTY